MGASIALYAMLLAPSKLSWSFMACSSRAASTACFWVSPSFFLSATSFVNSVLRAARSSLDKSFKVTASVVSASTSVSGARCVLAATLSLLFLSNSSFLATRSRSLCCLNASFVLVFTAFIFSSYCFDSSSVLAAISRLRGSIDGTDLRTRFFISLRSFLYWSPISRFSFAASAIIGSVRSADCRSNSARVSASTGGLAGGFLTVGAVVTLLVAGSAVTSSVGLALAAIFFLVRCISVGVATSSVTRGLLPVGVTSSSCASGVPFKNLFIADFAFPEVLLLAAYLVSMSCCSVSRKSLSSSFCRTGSFAGIDKLFRASSVATTGSGAVSTSADSVAVSLASCRALANSVGNKSGWSSAAIAARCCPSRASSDTGSSVIRRSLSRRLIRSSTSSLVSACPSGVSARVSPATVSASGASNLCSCGPTVLSGSNPGITIWSGDTSSRIGASGSSKDLSYSARSSGGSFCTRFAIDSSRLSFCLSVSSAKGFLYPPSTLVRISSMSSSGALGTPSRSSCVGCSGLNSSSPAISGSSDSFCAASPIVTPRFLGANKSINPWIIAPAVPPSAASSAVPAKVSAAALYSCSVKFCSMLDPASCRASALPVTPAL